MPDTSCENAVETPALERRIPVVDSSRFLPWLAVLASQKISYRVEYLQGEQSLIIAEQDAPRVQQELTLYEQNTAAWRKRCLPEETDLFLLSPTAFWSAVLFFSLLLRFHQLLNNTAADWQSRGLWNAGLIRQGEWWRCLTALSLHGDYAHLIGNLFWGCMLLTLTAGEIGVGWGILLMLIAGALGNLFNALLLSQVDYQALGASTMVFGLLGILSGRTTLKTHLQQAAGKGILQQFRLWIPLLAGFAVLSLWGTAPGSDLPGHLTGFLCGILLGLLSGLLPPALFAMGWQLLAGAVAAALLPLAWHLAWLGGKP